MSETKTAPQATALEPATAQLPQVVTPGPSLADRAAMIQHLHHEAVNAVARGAWYAIQAGHALIAAKADLKAQRLTGMWEEYIVVQCRMSPRTAQHYMSMAKREDKLREQVGPEAQCIAFISQAKALKMLGAAKKKRRRR